MHVSKEIRIGLLATAALAIFFIGFNFLKGSNLFASDKEYYTFYPNVEGLQNSSSVQIRGLNVGRISNMELIDGQGVKVTLALHKNVEVPQGTVASIAAADLLGTKIIRLDLGAGPGKMEAGSNIPGLKAAGIIDKVTDELTPRLQEIKGTIMILDSTLAGINSIMNQDNRQAITSAIQSIKATADNLSQLSGALSKEGGEMSGIIHNANSITGNLAKSNDTIQRILSNVNNITRQMAGAPIQKTLASLQQTSSELQGIMNKINTNQGSLGKLVNDKEMYDNLNKSLKSITNLTDDLKAHPGRYINVSVFGGKKKS